LGVEPGIY
jgi:hypothetical protein